MNTYCTLFDSNYLSRGLLMYESLVRHRPGAHLYIFPFDEKCQDVLLQLNLSNATVVKRNDFENDTLVALKKSRTEAEYCWTCTPWITEYVLNTYQVDGCTYLDADLFFYDDPAALFEEMPASYKVLITPHRYTPQYDQSATSGIYCVQFLWFANNTTGRNVLEWWKNACTDWCYNRFEDGKFGDQKYLDDWPERFKGAVWVLRDLGGGVAPWNVQQYQFRKQKGKIRGREFASEQNFDLIFFHFHACSFQKLETPFSQKTIVNYFSGYNVTIDSEALFYKPYAKELLRKSLELQQAFHLPIKTRGHIKWGMLELLKQKLKNIHKLVPN